MVEFREILFYGAQGQQEYARDLAYFLGRLDEHARSHTHAYSFVMTPLLQHFNTSDGAYAPSVQTKVTKP